jgi:hypothetical protein
MNPRFAHQKSYRPDHAPEPDPTVWVKVTPVIINRPNR